MKTMDLKSDFSVWKKKRREPSGVQKQRKLDVQRVLEKMRQQETIENLSSVLKPKVY